MVHVKKVDVRGFKSFGTRHATVHFDKGLIGISGPNGSGKSNILDAIMFCLGQNNPRTMRVNRLSELIYDGSGSDAPQSSKATLTLDNSDRLIPIDQETVTLSREIRSTGDSVYLLNGKKTQKSNIIEILSLSMIDPNGLNFVPQGMVTKLAELAPEEKRMIIEEIVGVSQFEEKKEQSIKQLDDADRKLEVYMARMGEVRSQIQSLEGERNDQLRLKFLEKEVQWLRSIHISNEITQITHSLDSLQNDFDNVNAESETLDNEISTLNIDIEKLEKERKKLFDDIVEGQGEKLVDIQIKVSNKRNEVRGLKNELSNLKAEHLKLSESIPYIITMKNEKLEEINKTKQTVSDLQTELDELLNEKSNINSNLSDLHSKRNTISDKLNKSKINYEKYDAKLTTYNKALSELQSNLNSFDTRNRVLKDRSNNITEKLKQITESINKWDQSIMKLKKLKQNQINSISNFQESNKKLIKRKQLLENEVENAILTLNNANEAVIKHETQLFTKSSQDSSKTYSNLLETNVRKSLVGKVDDIITIPSKHKVPILAALKRWNDSIIVQDIESLLLVAQKIKHHKYGRVTLIPLKEFSNYSFAKHIPNSDIIGNMAEIIKIDSKYKGLLNFLFGDTLLVRNAKTAYMLSKNGFRTITPSGDIFEPKLSILETGTLKKFSDLILDSKSYDAINDGIKYLKNSIEKRKKDIQMLNSQLDSYKTTEQNNKFTLSQIDNELQELSHLSTRWQKSKKDNRIKLKSTNNELQRLETSIRRYNKLINRLNTKIEKVEKLSDKGNTITLNDENIEIENSRSTLMQKLDDLNSKSNTIVNEQTKYNAKLEYEMQSELEDLTNEIVNHSKRKVEIDNTLETIEINFEEQTQILTTMEKDEKHAIEENQKSKPILNEYENQLKNLNKSKDQKNKTLNAVSTRKISISKTIESKTTSKNTMFDELKKLGYSEPLDSFEGAEIIKDKLENEYNKLKHVVNLLADKNYHEIYDGYKRTSERTNQLESERDRIIAFIDSVDSEKRTAFLEAYEKIDKELRKIFSLLTNGSAWLELEDENDIFNGGVFLMAKFPNKSIARESSRGSGGEKTVSALSLILAIQAINPSPFYMFDEIDAHLDALNSDRLADLLKQRSVNSQILIVSLKDTLLSRADCMYGVYMKDSVSKVVKYQTGALTLPAAVKRQFK
ncbi:MAG: chromosome segregation SMC family protein [Thermoproteota archaeon]